MGNTYDALLLDIHLPEMDGFAVAQAIREHERSSGRRLPIIAFTARTGKTDRERCAAAGMDDFLSKPVQAEALWEVIDRVISVRTPAGRQGSNLLDPRVISAACGGDDSILRKICLAFQATAPDQLAGVRSALADKDATRLREAAHALSSTLAAFSTIAGSTASKIEEEAESGRLETCPPLVAQLESMGAELLEQTRDLSLEKLHR
jgi:two-component system, sensor histidine kinase and response regulator